MKLFYCGICKDDNYMTRGNLRKHLREFHWKKRQLTNFDDATKGQTNQPWWKFKEFK